MRNLVIGIEYLLFIIFIVYLGFGICIATMVEKNPILEFSVLAFFVALFLGAIYLAYRSIRATKRMFEGITDTPLAFLRKKIKQDKSFILLILITAIEVLMTLFWLVFISIFVYIPIMFNTDNGFLGDQEVLPMTIITFLTPYLAFLGGSYYVLKKIIKFITNKAQCYYTKFSIVSFSVQILFITLILSLFIIQLLL